MTFRASFLIVAAAASAASAQVFDITSVSPSNTSGLRELAGTSNGIAWTISATDYYQPFSTIDGSYAGFGGGNFSPALPLSDRAHVGSADFTLTFETAILELLVYVSENSPDLAQIDFGIAPQIVSGDIRIDGTAFGPGSVEGGIVRLMVDSATLRHTAVTPTNSLNLAFVPVVPSPGAAGLLAAAALVAGSRRRR